MAKLANIISFNRGCISSSFRILMVGVEQKKLRNFIQVSYLKMKCMGTSETIRNTTKITKLVDKFSHVFKKILQVTRYGRKFEKIYYNAFKNA